MEIPTIEIRPRHSSQLDGAIREINGYDWLIFSSVSGVEVFLERARQLGLLKPLADRSEFPKIGAIGPATARKVQQYGYPVDLIPQVFQAEGLLEDFLSLHDQDIAGLKILLPRASRAREILPRQLRQRGAKVVMVPVYDTVLPKKQRQKLAQILKEESLDLITFTSSSTVHHFVAMAGHHRELARFCYAGPSDRSRQVQPNNTAWRSRFKPITPLSPIWPEPSPNTSQEPSGTLVSCPINNLPFVAGENGF